ncbi:MAG: Uma2 family endonuclease [Isosphaeraceae bacterium]
MSKENEEQSRCGPDRLYDPLPGSSLPGEDRCEVGLTGRNRGFAPRRQVSELILTWRDRLLDRCDLSTTIFRRNVRQGEVFLPRPPPLSPSGQVDISDAAFTSWERLPGRERPGKPIPDLAPDLAVEILSKSNTKAEMKRKLAEYFQAGTRRGLAGRPQEAHGEGSYIAGSVGFARGGRYPPGRRHTPRVPAGID